MEFNEYQKIARKTALGSTTPSNNVLEPSFVKNILGLGGEAGEVQEKFKKIIRDNNGQLADDDKKEIAKELGDVLWYISAICDRLGIDLESVAALNAEKLASRNKRNKLSGSGDNR